ncbi:MAG: hypothetical protein P4L99_21865 [Chthoniobacter sp.]|nr:hypothetical protein [Chthoniobacter sp.]
MTHFRGPLAIHSSLEFTDTARALCRREPFARALLGNDDLPTGCVIAISDLTAVLPTDPPKTAALFDEVFDLTESERDFADFSPGRFAWHLKNVRALEVPIPARGASSLWHWDEAALGPHAENKTLQTRMKKKLPSTQFQVRQGDILIERVAALPALDKKSKTENGRVILAHGEVTGHAHEIEKPTLASLHEIKEAMRMLGDIAGAEAMTQAGLVVKEDTAVVHDEHSRIALPKGGYIVRRQREYSPEEIRNVAD